MNESAECRYRQIRVSNIMQNNISAVCAYLIIENISLWSIFYPNLKVISIKAICICNIWSAFVRMLWLKFGLSEKATKIWNNLPLNLLSKQVENCFELCGLHKKPAHYKKINWIEYSNYQTAYLRTLHFCKK